MHWLIDSELFPAYREELIAAIGRAGHLAVAYRSPSPPYRWSDTQDSYRRLAPPGGCVVCHGDIEFVTRVGREKLWTPGVLATLEHFHCSHYYCRFGEHLLNRDYVMLPFGELRRRKEFLFDTVGQGGRIFVRPDSPLKLFTGQTAGSDTFEADLEFIPLKLSVQSRVPGMVPLFTVEPTDHPLAVEQREGMTVERWHAIVHQLLHADKSAKVDTE